jgi:hypothetical protein
MNTLSIIRAVTYPRASSSLSLEDREDHDRGGDVRDDEQKFQEASEEDTVVVPAAGDVRHGIVEHGLVEECRRDRRDERDEVEHAEDARPLLVQRHLRPLRRHR